MTDERGSRRSAARVGYGAAARPATPADNLAWRASETPSATALSWDGGRWTYRDLDARATALANRLRALGAAPGEAATLCATPSAVAVAALFGVWRIGCVAAPLHERLTPPEVDHARQIVMSRLHIDNSTLHMASGPGMRTAFEEVRTGIRGAPARVNGRSRYAGFPDVSLLILTSGSSGAPRAIGFTQGTLAASASAVARRLRLTADDRWGLCLSPGHIGGLSLIVRAVMTGSSVRLWPSFDAGAVARSMLAGRVSHLAVVPVMLRRMLDRLAGERAPPTLRCVLVGGAAASRPLLEKAWEAGLPVATTWGMTETASQVATAPPELARMHPETAGRPLRGVEVRRAPGGALCVRGPTLASLVVRGPGAPPEPLPTDADGWFSTRDLGEVDAAGLVRIEGRADATIVSGGLNVSPAEVERVIEELPGVCEAVVFGMPDEDWGEAVAAVVEGGASAVTAEDVDRHCRERLVRGRCPTRIAVVDELPRTWTGKAMRSRVRERYGPELRARSTLA
ncbi:MAG: AMP-binding protein [Gemmatimonadota bacterium]|nr:AMP-binding protein [Gemmatimonadota bacterium]